MTDYKDEQGVAESEESKSRFKTYKSTQIIWFIFGLIEAILGLRSYSNWLLLTLKIHLHRCFTQSQICCSNLL